MRRTLFSQLNQRAQRIVAMSEGLLTYLDEEKATSLAADLRTQPHFHYSLIEVVSSKVLQFINRKWAHHFKAANAPTAFAPADWRKFYRDRGWEPVEFEDMSQTARQMNREPGMMKVFRTIGQVFPSWGARQRKIWESGVALLRRA